MKFLFILFFISNVAFATQVETNTNNIVKQYLMIEKLKNDNKQLLGQYQVLKNQLQDLEKKINELAISIVLKKSTSKKQQLKIIQNPLYQKAKKALNNLKYKEAIKLFKEHLTKKPNNIDATYYWLAKSYLYANNKKEANIILKKIIDNYPNSRFYNKAKKQLNSK
ncbi:hypothetical protein MNB_SUP05-5-936 [hydrothermal vent metagenome]|uniref:Uncharacterized protein n=1 Tax=hydrothermal vent metagenome TaxID=652676 RepID=A0A1W1CCR0_9ZZZZ